MANKTNLSIGAVIAVLAAAYFGIDLKQDAVQVNQPVQVQTQTSQSNTLQQEKSAQPKSLQADADDLAQIARAFGRKQSDVQVRSSGIVKAVLKDDNEGSRHQKFILLLSNGQTVLVAHNIDLAPRIENIQKGDRIDFYGEYEYSAQGGVIHWTHHDPQRSHVDGWLKHQGKTYQ